MAEAKRTLLAILAADVVGYSRLMGDDERATMEMLNVCRDVFRKHISDHSGRLVDTAGDSVLATFPSVVVVVGCAVGIQGDLVECNADPPESRRMLFRIGVNLGDVLEQEDGTIPLVRQCIFPITVAVSSIPLATVCWRRFLALSWWWAARWAYRVTLWSVTPTRRKAAGCCSASA